MSFHFGKYKRHLRSSQDFGNINTENPLSKFEMPEYPSSGGRRITVCGENEQSCEAFDGTKTSKESDCDHNSSTAHSFE